MIDISRVLPAARLLVVTPALLVAAACEVNLNTEGISARETRTFQVAGAPEVALDTFDGAIEVHSWDRAEVEVEIEKRAMEQRLIDEMTVTAEQTGDRIVVKVAGPSRREFSGVTVGVHISPTARLRVVVPRAVTLEAVTGDGAIQLEDLEGRVTARTSDGSIRALRVAGELTARTSDGSIRMERVSGRLDLETSDGSIVLEARPSLLKAKTGDGSIRVQVAPDAEMAEDWDLQTGDGSIVLTLPAAFDATIDAETRDGRVTARHPALATESRDGEDRDERRRRLTATLGTGGKLLRLRSGDGSIRIEN
ncbi:MAG: DUF4097 family beta strand repeat-containing protein [Acidobacteriota bacterium]